MKTTAIAVSPVCVLLVAASVACSGAIVWTPAHELAPQGMSSTLMASDLDCDGDIDITMFAVHPAWHYWNVGSAMQPEWSVDTTPFADLSFCWYRAGSLADLDADGDLDLAMVCADDEFVRCYWNEGDCTAPTWSEDLSVFAGIPMALGGGQPRLADMDSDGDLDLVYVSSTGRVRYARNVGTLELPSFEYVGYVESIPFGFGSNATMALGDIDADGDLDLVRVASETQPDCFENVGGPQSFAFVANPQMLIGPEFPPDGYGKGIELADLDGDGDADLLLAVGMGQNLLYLNDGVVPVEPTSWGRIKALYR